MSSNKEKDNYQERVYKELFQRFDPESQKNKLASAMSAFDLPQFDLNSPQVTQFRLIPNHEIARAQFVPIPQRPGEYFAHPITIRAIRKDITMGGEEFVDLECLYHCPSCKNQIDVQFWQFCPFCEASIKF